jgi:hypothetical protein
MKRIYARRGWSQLHNNLLITVYSAHNHSYAEGLYDEFDRFHLPFFPHDATAPIGPASPLSRLHDHTQTHHVR